MKKNVNIKIDTRALNYQDCFIEIKYKGDGKLDIKFYRDPPPEDILSNITKQGKNYLFQNISGNEMEYEVNIPIYIGFGESNE